MNGPRREAAFFTVNTPRLYLIVGHIICGQKPTRLARWYLLWGMHRGWLDPKKLMSRPEMFDSPAEQRLFNLRGGADNEKNLTTFLRQKRFPSLRKLREEGMGK